MIVNPVRPLRRLSLLASVVICAAIPGAAHADKYAGAFMESGGGARALGMGAAFTAVADDPSTTFWNPAGLAGVTRRELLLMHSERFGDLIDRDFAAYVQPVGWRLFGGQSAGVGISLIRLGVDDIPFTNHLTDDLDDNGDGTVDDEELLGLFDLQDQIRYKSDQEFGLLLSYGEQKGAWRVGGSLKFIRQSVGPYSSLGVGADLAVLRPAIWKRLDFGLKLQDVTTTYLSWSTGHNEVITPAIVPGLAWRQPVARWNMDVTLAGSLETRFDNRGDADQYSSGSLSANAHAGLELGFSQRVFVRTGFDGGFDAGHFAAGAGFRLEPLTIDYAYAGDALEIDEVTHRISVSVRF
ncbi:MAG: PorV/PorQ family protein [bacterium]|nr:PorV/PorQ family protein [bacterium]MBK7770698.1 PorV/PorQ family protein [bacterium]MBK9775252.1 PorV/PorQ family protein [bacterium]